jgi:hypothetical protein
MYSVSYLSSESGQGGTVQEFYNTILVQGCRIRSRLRRSWGVLALDTQGQLLRQNNNQNPIVAIASNQLTVRVLTYRQ